MIFSSLGLVPLKAPQKMYVSTALSERELHGGGEDSTTTVLASHPAGLAKPTTLGKASSNHFCGNFISQFSDIHTLIVY